MKLLSFLKSKFSSGTTPPQQTIPEEAGLPDNWVPIDSDPIIPGQNNGPAPYSSGINLSSGPLPPNFGTQSPARYPASVARSDDGNLSDNCRPVEAVLLLYRLERSRGVSPGLRQLVESGNFNYPAGQQASPGPLNTQLVPGPHAGDDVIRNAEANRAAALEREREYVSARDAFFSAHPNIDPLEYIERLLDLLQIS